MKLKKPLILKAKAIEEERYLIHCESVARILADKNGWGVVKERLVEYFEVTGAELE